MLFKKMKYAVLAAIFISIVYFSFSSVEDSISVIKHHLDWGFEDLMSNYELFKTNPAIFFLRTSAMHQGNSPAGWSTIFYLLPLFIFVKIAGCLCLKNLYYFTILSALASLILYYIWIRKNWGEKISFFSFTLLGFSAIFQEFGRSGGYASYSMLFGIIFIIFLYKAFKNKTFLNIFLVGFLSGICMYGYGALRSLILAPLCLIFLEKRNIGRNVMGFVIGFCLLVVPGIFFKAYFYGDYLMAHPVLTFFDPEHIFSKNFFYIFKHNAIDFLFRISGVLQRIPPFLDNNYHAHFVNKALFIPFIVGVIVSVKKNREERFLFLNVISLFIFLTPMFTSNWGYSEARRSILYIIPLYLYIGLGINFFFEYIKQAKSAPSRLLMQIFVAVIVMLVIINEVLFSQRFILHGSRDIGILEFSRIIKKTNMSGFIYYLSKKSQEADLTSFRRTDTVYLVSKESDILRLALGDVKNLKFIEDPQTLKKNNIHEFYLVKSPLVSNAEFKGLCDTYKLTSRLIYSLPVANCRNRKIFEPSDKPSFSLYFARQL